MPPLTTQQLRELDKRHVWHPFTHMQLWLDDDPLVITHAQGMYLFDSDGRRYLDGVSSLWCNVHGHRVPQIDQAIIDQLGRVAHTTLLGLSSEPSILLAQKLASIAPPGLVKVFYSDSGATATEVAFKLAVQYWHNLGFTGKTEFISFANAYHGDTFGAMSIGRVDAFHQAYLPMLFPVHFAPSPDVYHSQTPAEPEAVKRDCLLKLEAMLEQRAGHVAAICLEPMVQGAGGILVQPAGFVRAVRKLATKYDVLLIADEVAVGFGRTGRLFACEHEQAVPDLMCLAKGITGGYLPLAATLATQRVFDAFLGAPADGKTFFHGHTYTGNPLACAAALASIDLIEQNNLIPRVQEKARSLAEMLVPLRSLKYVGDVRQLGFMVGIELVEDKAASKPFAPERRIGAQVCASVREHGVIIRPLGDVLVLMPPLAMELDHLRTIVDAVALEIDRLA